VGGATTSSRGRSEKPGGWGSSGASKVAVGGGGEGGGGINVLKCRAYFPKYRAGNIVAGKGPLMNFSWEEAMSKDSTGQATTGILQKSPVLQHLPRLCMRYFHKVVFHDDSRISGCQPPEEDNPAGMLAWLQTYTDGVQYPCAKNLQGGVGVWDTLQIANRSRTSEYDLSQAILRVSPHEDYTFHGKPVIGPCVRYKEADVDKLGDDECMDQFGQVECFFSFYSKGTCGNIHIQNMALVRKMEQLDYKNSILLASCNNTESNPNGAKMLQVINVQSILGSVLLVLPPFRVPSR
jgi:hypothetical protein